MRLADRFASGATAPYDDLADCSRRLADSPDRRSCCPRSPTQAATAAGAAGGTAVLHVPAGDDLAASTCVTDSRTGAAALELPKADGEEQLGVLRVVMPASCGLRLAVAGALLGPG